MTKKELHRVIAVNSGGLIGAERIRIAVDAYTQALLQQTEVISLRAALVEELGKIKKQHDESEGRVKEICFVEITTLIGVLKMIDANRFNSLD